MLLTNSLRDQHGRIIELVKEMSIKVNTVEFRNDTAPTMDLLIRLSGILNIHLAMEDQGLYPDLLKHRDQRVSDLARSYMDEMGNILQRFQRFIARWGYEQVIAIEPERFEKETREVLAALQQRIRREDNELYPLIELVGL